MRYVILTYWQIYAAMAVSALAAYWAGWGSCWLCYRPARVRHRPAHARRPRAALPAPLPAHPPLVAAALDARHANIMARTAPREPGPAAHVAAAVHAVTDTLAQTAITGWILQRWTADRDSPWSDATGSFPTVMLELEQEPQA